MPEEAKLKISLKMKEIRKTNNPMTGRKGELHPNFGKPMSDEQKKKLSIAHKGKPSTFKGKHHTEEAKRQISESKKGTIVWNKGLETGPHTKEHNLHIAQGVCNHPVGRGEWYQRLNGEIIWLRSSYEVRIARILDALKLDWKYEPYYFEMGNKFYIPDFLINDIIFWEVKGYLNDASIEKITTFESYYPDKNLKLIFNDHIKMLEKNLENNIPIEINTIGSKISEVI